MKTTMPDFHKWAINVTGLHCVYRLVGTEEALKQAFDQGYSLGYRDSVEAQEEREDLANTQEWWEPIDRDEVYKEQLGTNVVQRLDTASGCYIARYVDTGKEVGRNCGGRPFKSIPIEE